MSSKETTQQEAPEAHDGDEKNELSVFVARQPIFDNNLHVYGYELLFRDAMTDTANIADGDEAANQATSKVLLNTIMELDLDRLVDGRIAFFNMTRQFLMAGANLPLNASNVGIEILESVPIDDGTIQAAEELSLLGFTIALDDFDWRPGIERLLNLASIVKIDVLEHGEQAIIDMIDQLRPYKLRLVAEKVETQEQFEFCRELGFHYFQGFFLCRPNTVAARRLPENRLNTLRLIAKLQDPEVTPDEVENIIKHDVTLNYRLLKSVNSAYYGLSVRIRSVGHAIVYLGMPSVRNWANLLLLAGLEDRPNELVRLALVRARMCEILTEDKPSETRDGAFTTGLFSMLDALLDIPMNNIMEQLPLDEDLALALSEREGPYGRLLSTVIACERGDWKSIHSELFTNQQLAAAYFKSVDWATGQFKALRSEA